jgi:hypothetical protein
LGLALEVRKIEQQLAMMNKAPATYKTEAHHKPLKAQGRLQTKAVTPRKKTRQYAALAGKVNQLAKQIVSCPFSLYHVCSRLVLRCC